MAKFKRSGRWQNFRDKILERDNYICFYCDEPGDTVDHLTPTSRGGKLYSLDNCVCACLKCNREKGDRLLSEYLNDCTARV
jgi:5-methylcytosine-specific restriction endonuclease McrA